MTEIGKEVTWIATGLGREARGKHREGSHLHVS